MVIFGIMLLSISTMRHKSFDFQVNTNTAVVQHDERQTMNTMASMNVLSEGKSFCCARFVLSHLENPYFPVSRNVLTQEDRLSSLDMKQIADFHYGTLPQLNEHQSKLIMLNNSTLPCLADGAVLFVSTMSVKPFLQFMLPQITTKFVLVTADSDASMPADLNQSQLQGLLQDERLLHWYARNCDRNPNPKRFTCLPLGLSDGDQRQMMQAAYERGLGFLGLKRTAAADASRLQKNITLLAAFRLQTNPNERRRVWDMACQRDGILYNYTRCVLNLGLDKLYDWIATSKFVLSPHGAGLDCYRTYETLYLGSFPVVKTSSLDEIFTDLPVLILKDWSELAKKGFLETQFKKLTARMNSFHWMKLTKGYWYAKFRSHYPSFVTYKYYARKCKMAG